MRLSARNQLTGTVTSVTFGNVMCEVVVDIGGGKEMVSAITKSGAESLGLEVGVEVTVVVKATEVMLARN
jgi:molybdate transport system regulatory protein